MLYKVKEFMENAKKENNQDLKRGKHLQDEMKAYNERFPKSLEPLHKMRWLLEQDFNTLFSGGIGEFSDVSGEGSGVGGQLGYVEKGKFWTSDDLTKHDLKKTTSTLTSGQLDNWINKNLFGKKSNFSNMGEAFMEAGRLAGLDPRYLIAHSAIETGWGNRDGSVAINEDKHNFYGIGAFDSSAYESAYDWSDPKEGIIGGAEWIAKNYVYSEKYKQGTLHKMRHNNGVHQYATDSEWHTKIASTMKGSEAFTTASEGGVPEFSGSANGNFSYPFKIAFAVTSDFGTRGGAHQGIDLATGDRRIPMYPIAPGVVHQVAFNGGGWGHYIVIFHGDRGGKDLYSLYAHTEEASPLSVGASVNSSISIGREGNTGNVAGGNDGYHLHLEVREVSKGAAWNQDGGPKDPRNYLTGLKASGTGYGHI